MKYKFKTMFMLKHTTAAVHALFNVTVQIKFIDGIIKAMVF